MGHSTHRTKGKNILFWSPVSYIHKRLQCVNRLLTRVLVNVRIDYSLKFEKGNTCRRIRKTSVSWTLYNIHYFPVVTVCYRFVIWGRFWINLPVGRKTLINDKTFGLYLLKFELYFLFNTRWFFYWRVCGPSGVYTSFYMIN